MKLDSVAVNLYETPSKLSTLTDKCLTCSKALTFKPHAPHGTKMTGDGIEVTSKTVHKVLVNSVKVAQNL